MQIAVTGATGFVGQEVCWRLRKQGHQVLALIRNLNKTTSAQTIQKWKVGKSKDVDLSGVEVLIHLAAYLPESYQNSAEAERCLIENSLGTLDLLQTASAQGVKAFVYMSSGQIYDCKKIGKASESDSVYPSFRAPYYLASKLVGEIYVDHWGQNSPMKTIILRPSSIFGRGMKSSGPVHRVVEKLRTQAQVTYQELDQYFIDLVDVFDVAWLTEKVAVNYQDPLVAGIFNVGGGQKISIPDLAKIIAKLMGCPEKYQEGPAEEFRIHAPKEHLELDISAARYNLQYCPLDLTTSVKYYLESLGLYEF